MIRTPTAATRAIRRNTNRRHMMGDHHGRAAERASPLLRATAEIFGTHKAATIAAANFTSQPEQTIILVYDSAALV
jgi:hypothetical protein